VRAFVHLRVSIVWLS